MAEIITLKEDLCESCEHTLICVNEDPSWPTYECRYYLKRRAHGHWIIVEEGPTFTHTDCSVCDEEALSYWDEGYNRRMYFRTPFCPHCGAIMDEEAPNE